MKEGNMRTTLIVSLTLVLSAAACQRKQPAPVPAASAASTPTKAAVKVTRIAFLDKEHACPCTRKRIDDAWAALQTALGTPASLPVERIPIDTQPAQVATLTAAKPLMVPPGIYFLDANNTVLSMLQGEVTTDQIAATLHGR
jgi:hypothetical protein